MDKQIDWMMNFIPTIIGALILVSALFSGYGPILSGYLRLVSLSSVMNTFMRNSLGVLKWFHGPGG